MLGYVTLSLGRRPPSPRQFITSFIIVYVSSAVSWFKWLECQCVYEMTPKIPFYGRLAIHNVKQI